jgi:MoxR-like ATPase
VAEPLLQLKEYIGQQIVGQERLVNRLLIALLADGHLLVEGAPGLAKTRSIKVLADGIRASFHRIQFTPDLLPADLTGTDIYRPQDGSFVFQQGPLFHNLILADEINRAPAKVQSALLEAMGERQITVGRKTYTLPKLFLVMATQNPIEQEGTYPLPEAQLDRFLMHVNVGYPNVAEERAILKLNRSEADRAASAVPDLPAISEEQIFAARHAVLNLHLAPDLEEYLIRIIMATRNPAAYGDDLAGWLEYGASPRATIGLDRCARAHAWLAGRDFVAPEDIQAVAYDVLRHRIILRFEAEAEGVTPDRVIGELIARIAVP